LSTPLAIYVHIPFCAKHCAYCDFNTYVEKSRSELVNKTVLAIRRDIEQTATETETETETNSRSIHTIFFGGGTPTFLSGEQLSSILNTIRNCYDVAADAEISSEANPGSSDSEKFNEMRQAGFNRLSIGVQSFDDQLLIALDRFHTSSDANSALEAAGRAGFASLNLDLMFGLPHQTLALWAESLQIAQHRKVDHLSLYALTLEPGTRFERLHTGGKLPLPDEDVELAMYEQSIESLQRAGYTHYEVSNFAKPGHQCRHNLVYWHNEEYIGFGPGAVSYLHGCRYKRERLPGMYCSKVDSQKSLIVESEQLNAEGALGETMMLGLRLRSGIDTTRITDRFDIDPLQQYARQISKLVKLELLEQQGTNLKLTHRGLLLANTVLAEFLPEVAN